MNNLLSIVIPCKNEGRLVISTLRMLSKQNLDCQIIVADSSTDDTLNKLFNYKIQSHQLIKIISGGIPAIARNKGAKLVKTPYVLFLDADMYIHSRNLLKDCIEKMQKDDLDLLTCKFKTTDGKFNYVYRIFDFFQKISSITSPFAIGGFMLFKIETFKKLGGFNEKNQIAEDYYISQKIKPKKFKVFNGFVYTSSRRFRKKGVWYMIKLAWLSWINRKNENFFNKDYKNYWK